jgi:L-asparaginase
MTLRKHVLLAAACLATIQAADAADRPHIRILGTGGTIAAGRSGLATAEALAADVPGLDTRAALSYVQVANVPSSAMNESVSRQLAAAVAEARTDPAVAGVVVIHGTDTLEETAWFLELTAFDAKPVVLTGAMRRPTDPGADGPANLDDAVTVAAAPAARDRGVLVVLGGEIHAAREAAKLHATRPAAFGSPNTGPLGRVRRGQEHFFFPPSRAPLAGAFPLRGAGALPPVDIVFAYAGLPRRAVDDAVRGGAAGLVLAGLGEGNAPPDVRRALGEAQAAGVIVVRATRTGAGAVATPWSPASEEVLAGDLSPAKARILLQLLLANGVPAEERADWFRR